MMLLREEVPSNSVPADAVIPGGQVLFGMIRRKEFFKRFSMLPVLLCGLNPRHTRAKLLNLSVLGDSRIHGVVVKSYNPVRNTSGEGDYS
jgi:hypothetical protein